ncbi:slipin family protein [Lonsdalea quercina]|uniref:SPFH domain / Band 7 family protein n=1 Tax=Lonsdalea quercina TaxID=71657 RepID=A0A1H4CJ53_9GAMM|nr:slipin family protein [Lonsdalea quercina]SEA60455.1 SPFH domain / Band 7 family protein [Lonsdalea quercina]
MFKTITIRKGQLGLVSQDGDYLRVLEAGRHRLSRWFNRQKIDIISLDGAEVLAPLDDYLRQYHPEWVKQYCLDVVLPEEAIGLRYDHDVLQEILPPATRRLYWRKDEHQRVDQVKTDDIRVPDALVSALLQPTLRQRQVIGHAGVLLAQVPAWHLGLLKVDGAAQELLPPGVSGYWRFNHCVEVELVDTRQQALEVSGQEILTRDKVNLRLNLVANWRYSDILTAYGQLTKPVDSLYRELQFALREAVGTRTLDELLENKHTIDERVNALVCEKMAGYGIDVVSLGVKDIVLPGDMKTILSQVVEAEKAAQANVIRRREETSATRSLLNTAKVMENNPVALRLKELETLERVAERIDKISVFGGLDQVLNGLVNLKGA